MPLGWLRQVLPPSVLRTIVPPTPTATQVLRLRQTVIHSADRHRQDGRRQLRQDEPGSLLLGTVASDKWVSWHERCDVKR